MTNPLYLSCLLLLSSAGLPLLGCGTPAPAVQAWEGTNHESHSTCDAPQSDRCVVFACEEAECGAFRCEDVSSEAAARVPLAHDAELARGFRPPMRSPGTHRNWRRAGLREDARPQMTFHFRYRHGFLPAFPRLEGALRKHHLFPQASEFREWFRAHGINIHDWTMVISAQSHLRIHGNDERGGLWNEAWRQFMRSNLHRRLTQEELIRKAFELTYRFDIAGPIVPYGHTLVPQGPQFQAP
ncbi:TIGR02269 family lipoprotein [Stigmatella sp. ncwal1]|uniref:TIGR02269 family lipoprotein n=1 Tax=Stigmatella ashevillensis TaxID=2995309 RepID=A0ABT5D4A5_9BACT|nr:TIGR02269 family lipoprotein [Stigmatella ashevillena]MDC0707086.1 TIGR02269 family lipoprotein [Stigmatella ashevillena]